MWQVRTYPPSSYVSKRKEAKQMLLFKIKLGMGSESKESQEGNLHHSPKTMALGLADEARASSISLDVTCLLKSWFHFPLP